MHQNIHGLREDGDSWSTPTYIPYIPVKTSRSRIIELDHHILFESMVPLFCARPCFQLVIRHVFSVSFRGTAPVTLMGAWTFSHSGMGICWLSYTLDGLMSARPANVGAGPTIMPRFLSFFHQDTWITWIICPINTVTRILLGLTTLPVTAFQRAQEMLKNLTTDYDYLAHPGLITNEQVQVPTSVLSGWKDGTMKWIPGGLWWK